MFVCVAPHLAVIELVPPLPLFTTISCLVICYIFANHAAVTHISSSICSSMLKSCPQKIDRQISRHVCYKVKSIFSSLGFQVSGLKNAGDICSPVTNFDFTLGTSSVRIIVYNWNDTVWFTVKLSAAQETGKLPVSARARTTTTNN